VGRGGLARHVPVLTFHRIILPQAVARDTPPYNDFVALFKDTSVVSIIAVVELSTATDATKSAGGYVRSGGVRPRCTSFMSVPWGTCAVPGEALERQRIPTMHIHVHHLTKRFGPRLCSTASRWTSMRPNRGADRSPARQIDAPALPQRPDTFDSG